VKQNSRCRELINYTAAEIAPAYVCGMAGGAKETYSSLQMIDDGHDIQSASIKTYHDKNCNFSETN